ncbi:hypothetical protein M5D96_010160 [Drosophila gunungcola]|uniref:Uncharacterized protein n=1 Tax=Drosophila gunungcola TaxID=103775 RepID=A0A9P9YH30_9MUSC|nr:hypothetical protein M5D96_010160 [Drosophila gunungcola]
MLVTISKYCLAVSAADHKRTNGKTRAINNTDQTATEKESKPKQRKQQRKGSKIKKKIKIVVNVTILRASMLSRFRPTFRLIFFHPYAPLMEPTKQSQQRQLKINKAKS